jgi:hypothetical protein
MQDIGREEGDRGVSSVVEHGKYMELVLEHKNEISSKV